MEESEAPPLPTEGNTGNVASVATATTLMNVSASLPSSANNQGSESSQSKGKRKVRDIGVLERLVTSFYLTIQNSKDNARMIAGAIVGQYGDKLGEILKQLGFSVSEVVRATRIFFSNPEAGRLFWGLDMEQKEAFIRDLLKEFM